MTILSTSLWSWSSCSPCAHLGFLGLVTDVRIETAHNQTGNVLNKVSLLVK